MVSKIMTGCKTHSSPNPKTVAVTVVTATCLMNKVPEPLNHGACAIVREGWSFQPRPLADGAFWSGADFVGLIGLNRDWLKRDPGFARRPR